MSSYVVTFRSPATAPTQEQEQAWADWFAQIGAHVTDFGHRVARTVMLGSPAESADQLSGYVVIDADTLDAAASIAQGCPGLTMGGRVEVGETVPS